MPVGVPGELWIAGDGVARGYFKRADLTAEKFVADPFSTERGARLYRTGDLVRYRDGGAIEFLGRIDHQVKVRGFRIELGEIEAALGRHPAVAQAVVVARGEGGDKRLVAYLVAREEAPGLAELRSHLQASLPDYMVPAVFVVLDALPLNPSGKVDRKALPAPEEATTSTTDFVAPRSPVEELLAGIWAEVLRVERVGVTQTFFELGGHSLLATRVVSRVRQVFGVELPLRRLFEAPTVARLAREIEAAGASALPPLPRRAHTEPPRLSFGQERLWFLDRLNPGSTAYNIAAAFRITGEIDLAAMERALNSLVRRHETLRTTFTQIGGEARQLIAPELELTIPVVDLRSSGEAEALRTLSTAARRPFDLEHGPLLRALLVRLGDRDWRALFEMHHIVSDGWSMDVLIREVGALYAGASELPELPIQYADYAEWQRDGLQGDALAGQMAYWRERLAGAPPVLDLPADRPRPAVQRYSGRDLRRAYSQEILRGLMGLGRAEGATVFMGLLSGFETLLHRYTGRTDVLVGTPVAGRTRVEVEGLIGLFLNSLVLRTDLGGDPSFRDLLARAREATLGAFAHQDLPFEKLVEELSPQRNLSHAPIFQVLLVLQNPGAESLELPGATLQSIELAGTTAKFDLTLNAQERDGRLLVRWLYNSDLFDENTIDRLSGHLERLLASAVADPDRKISDLALLTPTEERQILDWNATEVAYPTGLCLHELIEAQVERTPDVPAVTFGGQDLSYRELDAAANALAGRLTAQGVGPEVPVGVFAERSLEMVVALLAILKAGGAYLPIDPDYPADRVAYMLADSGVPVLLVQDHLIERLPEHGAAVVRLRPSPPWPPSPILTPDPPGEGGRNTEQAGDDAWDLETPLSRWVGCEDGRGAGGEGSLAYIIYTSGSTGRPKGTMNSHRGIVNRLLWMQAQYGLTADDRVLQKTPFSFDVSVWEFFWPLLTGARLVVARPGGHQDPAYLVETIVSEGITTLHFVPSMLQVFIEAPGVEKCASLQRVICSGEALPLDLEKRFDSRLGAGLHNLYGPTEAAVDVTYWACEREAGRTSVPIGRPVANTQIRLLDPHLRSVPVGVPGELHIGGVQLGRGYLKRPELTAEKFIPDPFGEPGSRLYKSGDLARYLPDGAVDFLGRIDHQVKVRGLRIELGEIEAALAKHPAIREAVVLARAGGSAVGDVNLVAYITVREGQPEPSLAELRSLLGKDLPDYMVPVVLVVLDVLPLSPNGKADRKALAQLAPERTTAPEEQVAPRSEVERFLARLWSEVLRSEGFGVHDRFFELGGNSITGAIFINRLQQELGEIVHVVTIFDQPTIAGLAAFLTAEYPRALERLFGALGETRAEAVKRVDEAVIAEVDRLVRKLGPLPQEIAAQPKGSTAVFVLSPPRSGSTLLRVMLAGHPLLFAPPELELLNFDTLAERRDAFPGRDAFRLEGLLRAVMEARRCSPDEARTLVDAMEAEGASTRAMYRLLGEQIGERTLVDKTPTYAWDPQTLARAEAGFANARYLHLVRHPLGMVKSFEEARIDQIFFHEDHTFSRREVAEALWVLAQRNTLDFLAAVPAARKHTVVFEELLGDPERVLRGICDFLGITYHPDMAEPYQKKSSRMTDGLHDESRMLGDVKFHQHGRVESTVAEKWREAYSEESLGEPARTMAVRLGYELQGFVPIPRLGTTPGTPLPVAFSQERLWFLDQLDPGQSTYNVPAALRLLGRLDVTALAGALGEVVRRHGSLRTTFAEGDGRPVQIVAAAVPRLLPVVDLSGLPEELRGDEAHRRISLEIGRPFNLGRGPLIRALLLKLSGDEHAAALTMHHIASDGWSMSLLIREVEALYEAFAQGRPSPLAELPIQYADFAVWQRGWLQGARLEQEIAWWRQRLAGVAPLDLPTDRPRPPAQTFRGANVPFPIDGGLSDAVAGLARREGATLFMTAMAAFVVLLRRYAGQDDVSVGTPSANRTRREIEDLIGFFVNTLVVRTDAAGDPGFRGLLGRVREASVGAFAHQEVPFEKVVEELRPERDLSRPPLFQVMFILQNARFEPLELPGLTLAPQDFETTTAKLDLTLFLFENPQGLSGAIELNTDLFDRSTIERMARHFQVLLAGATADPAARISELPLLTGPERAQLLEGWNATEVERPHGLLVHELFEARAARTPERQAVAFGGKTLTYRDLDEQANRLAHHLRGLGVGPETLVGLCVERSERMVVGLLGILKAGGAYVPLDPTHPAERISMVLEDAQVQILVTDDFLDQIAAERIDRPERWTDEESLAYVIYTSGSTGRPKGVQLPHRAVVNFLRAMAARPGFGPDDVIPALTTLSFDIAGLEIYLPLMLGGRIEVISREESADGRRLAERIASSGVTVMQATPATWRLLIDSGWEGLAGLKVLCGGEALPRDLADAIQARGADLWNVYGPTETAIWSATGPVGEGPVRIGSPIDNTRFYVVDPACQLVPVGVPGELWIAGDGVARGYFRRPDLTSEKFIANPFSGEPGTRLYRTGDLVRYREDGSIEFLGRIDHQVKVRGFRIELGEIEAALGRHPPVAQAVVGTRGEGGDKQLVAWLVGREDLSLSALRSFLHTVLPDYMVPAVFVVLDVLPLNPSGKVDRKALPAPEAASATTGEHVAPRGPVEELVAQIWAEVLRAERVGATDNFFDLGGHSLLATQVVSRVRVALGIELPLQRLFEAPTVAGLARAIEAARRAGEGTQLPPLVPVSRAGSLPLSFAQERMWFLHQIDSGATAYNLASAVRLRGKLDAAVLEHCFAELIRRHESLRTVFPEGNPVQFIQEPGLFALPRVDLRGLPAEKIEAEAHRLLAEEGGRRYDLAAGPLVRALLVPVGDEEHLLFLGMHHIVSDAWSMGVLVREIAALYRQSPLPELPVQYADYAAWQRSWLAGEVLDRQLAWWKRQLAGLPPLLELPTDRPRPAVQTFRGARRTVALPIETEIAAFSRSRGLTPFMTLLAAFEALLGRYTTSESLAVGAPIAGRNQAETEGLIGFFVNTLVLRADLGGDPVFADLTRRVRETALGAFAHQDVPFEKLVDELRPERSLSYSPLFQVMFNLQNQPVETIDITGSHPHPGRGGAAAGTARSDADSCWDNVPLRIQHRSVRRRDDRPSG